MDFTPSQRSAIEFSGANLQLIACAAWGKRLTTAYKAEVDPEEFTLKLTSEHFPARGYKRIAVKVVDVYGNESTKRTCTIGTTWARWWAISTCVWSSRYCLRTPSY